MSPNESPSQSPSKSLKVNVPNGIIAVGQLGSKINRYTPTITIVHEKESYWNLKTLNPIRKKKLYLG